MKRRVIPASAPFIRNHFQVDLTGEQAQRFDDAVKLAGMFKARLVRTLIIEWTDKVLPKATR